MTPSFREDCSVTLPDVYIVQTYTGQLLKIMDQNLLAVSETHTAGFIIYRIIHFRSQIPVENIADKQVVLLLGNPFSKTDFHWHVTDEDECQDDTGGGIG